MTVLNHFKSEIGDFKLKFAIADPGGGEGIRTPDPRVANAVLCQLSYTPEKANLRSQISNLKYSEVGCGGGI
jgi:hypothetical protein